ncbi:CRISPR-associated protein Csm2 [Caldicellulosiruptor bescii]|uniref:CRISPR system Cms protein Csm2 n=2 Tax=Caldicellulosiruptor bescii TaxID=31899 RepID=B9MPX5_CALBD|nr:type III-A CRISPR-associated protein Csm2 [Caldicellulosiruptor bescii]ACM61758.1 CRISPR-associated protein, Csm2 family [Caldicellulosiruptor bescii DSM 6725]PBC88442.1 CRISPR-associated protein Csm2 [Caldicellulosiruptor bescii]PBC92077.1 CRISPR-associated protein Csm2 [Caldicellulosiruptor bescii]PBD02508.1 CRISPR-associated protein Csm2 [Caldicellulosiruptor bescii]PBD05256.1 CRISPR-associated protein Csm2 [Caldicellulosiruptor bescii]
MPAQQNVNPIVSLKNDILSKIQTAIDPSKDKDGTVLAEVSEKTGQLLKDCGVTVTQLRKVFTEVKRLSPDDENYKYKLNLLKAKLAYTAGRFPKIKDFQEIVNKAIPVALQSPDALSRFKDFFEGAVAYHKYFGGRE